MSMDLPLDIILEVLYRLPIDLRVKLRVKPRKLDPSFAHALTDWAKLHVRTTSTPYHVHLASVRCPDGELRRAVIHRKERVYLAHDEYEVRHGWAYRGKCLDTQKTLCLKHADAYAPMYEAYHVKDDSWELGYKI